MIRKISLIFLILKLLAPDWSMAMEKEEHAERILKIGLVDCLAYSLKNNNEILLKRLEPKIKETEVKIARSDFEPTLTANFTLEETRELSASTLSGANIAASRQTDYNLGLYGKLFTGTEYDLDFLNQKNKSNSRYQSLNPYYTATPKITITQPLFRGAGILINTAEIIIARNNKTKAKEDFRWTVMKTITETKETYYNYCYSLENYVLAQTSLERSQDLLEINQARYEKGLVSGVDLLEIEAFAAEREKALLSAESNMEKAEDELKIITNLIEEPELWEARIELIDTIPEIKTEAIDLTTCLSEAFNNRPDYLNQKTDLQTRDIKIATAKNSLLPTIDLEASYNLNGLGQDYEAARKGLDPDYKDWSVGVKVTLPWGGEERAKDEQKTLEKSKALLSLKKLEQEIVLEIRDKVRTVDIKRRQVEVSRKLKEKENQNYQAQKERYAHGQISTHDMLDYQEKLAGVELDYFKSIIDYHTAISRLEQSCGLTLIKNNIKLEG